MFSLGQANIGSGEIVAVKSKYILNSVNTNGITN